MDSEHLNHHAAKEFPVLVYLFMIGQLKESEAEFSVFGKNEPWCPCKALDKCSFVNSCSCIGILVQESVLLVVFKIEQLDHTEEESCLEEWHEHVDQQCLMIDMHIVDANQVLKDLVACRI